ncbi:MAG: hypothetical protein EXX96DRAFT_596465 [Benjaminiella poitrasii]|nr:MAG: hypothetical protein EXX96DRAFT_596465 [Benjaminiella poitrasii]
MVESLPLIDKKKRKQRVELCTRYLQPCFQKLYDCDEDQFIFKWLNISSFSDTDVDPNQDRPDTGAVKYNVKHMFQIMAVGTNVQFNISEAIDDILMFLELDCIRFPLSLDKLPQLVPYLNRLYNVVEVIHHLCYTSNIFTISNSFKPALDAKIIKAIMEKSTDRTCEYPFYYSHH